ncbi:uncharacterized protein LOC144642904 [Oculina patagonica]
MVIHEWRVVVLAICFVLLLVHEVVWQWWWWRLDNTDTSITECSGNQILVSNDSKTVICQPCPICSVGTTLSPPCGSILTLDTVIKCTPILTKLPRGSKRKMSTKSELRKAHSQGLQNENFISRPSLDVRDIFDTEELGDANLSEMADFNVNELLSSTSSTEDFQEKATTSSTKYSLSNTMYRWRQRRVNPKFPTSKRTVPRPIASPTIKAKNWSGQFTAPLPVPEPMNKRSANVTAGPQNININCVLGGFLGTSLAWLLLGTALVWLWFSIKRTTHSKTWNNRQSGYYRLNGTEQSEKEDEEISFSNGNVDSKNATNSSHTVTTAEFKHVKLSEIPPDLEDLLVKKLDVRCKGERLYGWQKVGAVFKIANHDLDYLKLEYKRDNGSPTSKLLCLLGISKGKTVSDLMNVLKSPKVKLPDVASVITRYIKQANKIR